MNHPYLPSVIKRIRQTTEDATQSFCALSDMQLNWKPNPNQWSIGQCLDHLMVSNQTYFPIFDTVIAGTKTPKLLEKIPLLPEWWGKTLIKALEPSNTKKSKTFPVFEPRQSEVPPTIIKDFIAHQEQLLQYFQRLDAVDLNQIIITSPAASFVTYSLRDAVYILTNHEERHLLQAKNVLASPEFPQML